MKRFTIIISLILAAAMLAGCRLNTGSPLNTPVPPDGTKAPITDMTFTPLDPGSLADGTPDANAEGCWLFWDSFRIGGTSEEAMIARIFTDYDDFTENVTFTERGVAERYDRKSFDKMFVVAIYITANTGGWSYALEGADVQESVIDVKIVGTRAEGAVTQALERHIVLIAFDSELYTEGMTVSASVNGGATGTVKDK